MKKRITDGIPSKKKQPTLRIVADLPKEKVNRFIQALEENHQTIKDAIDHFVSLYLMENEK